MAIREKTGKPITIVYLKKWFQEAAKKVDEEFLTDETNGRKYVAVDLRRLQVTLFCPLHTIEKMSPEDWKRFNKGLMFIEPRDKGNGYIDFRKSFTADWSDDFFEVANEVYQWERTNRKTIYEMAEAKVKGGLGHDNSHDVRKDLYEKTTERAENFKKERKNEDN